MKRGILYVVWDSRPANNRSTPLEGDFCRELVYSVKCARRLELPIALLMEEGANLALDRSLFDQIVPFPPQEFAARNAYLRKLVMFDLSPFDETLFLDTDAFVVNEEHRLEERWPSQPIPLPSGFDYPFRKARQFGLAMACDNCVLGQRARRPNGEVVTICPLFPVLVEKYLPLARYVPLYNYGVVFFCKTHPQLAKVIEAAKEIGGREGCDEQIATTIAAELNDFTICTLEMRVWNCRDHKGPCLPWPGTRILHNPHWFNLIQPS